VSLGNASIRAVDSTPMSTEQTSPNSKTIEAGSFRDRKARVFYYNEQVFRALDEQAFADYKALSATKFFQRAISNKQIVATEETCLQSFPSEISDTDWKGVLQHERIPFVSYPYEWCFGMLKDTALLHLDLLSQALQENVMIKDSSAYNFQWVGARPVFIDIPSFERYQPGDLWAGYRQFCQMFLYPIMFQVYKGLPFQSWLRGNIDGISVEDANSLMSFRDRFRPGVLKHVYLQSKLQASYAGSARNVRQELKELGFYRELILANVKSLKKLLARLNLSKKSSVWTDYASKNSYEESDMQLKKEFVGGVIAEKKRALVWDIGCNTGTFSKIAAQSGAYVLAMDSDHLAVERMYQELKESKNENILPLVVNLANPSPNHGWRGIERSGLGERGKPDMIFALALIHHAVISANIPVAEFVSWLASFRSELIIEFVTKEDVMVKTLLANKEDNYDDYQQSYFESCLTKHYEISNKKQLGSGTRILYFCKPR